MRVRCGVVMRQVPIFDLLQKFDGETDSVSVIQTGNHVIVGACFVA